MEDLYFEQIEEQNRQLEMEYFMEMEREGLLTTRGSTHGDFASNSSTVQHLKDDMRQANFAELPSYMREALDMVQHKIGRILHGDPFLEDHWRDIVGYTQLVVDTMEKDERTTFLENHKYKVDENGVRINL